MEEGGGRLAPPLPSTPHPPGVTDKRQFLSTSGKARELIESPIEQAGRSFSLFKKAYDADLVDFFIVAFQCIARLCGQTPHLPSGHCKEDSSDFMDLCVCVCVCVCVCGVCVCAQKVAMV